MSAAAAGQALCKHYDTNEVFRVALPGGHISVHPVSTAMQASLKGVF